MASASNISTSRDTVGIQQLYWITGHNLICCACLIYNCIGRHLLSEVQVGIKKQRTIQPDQPSLTSQNNLWLSQKNSRIRLLMPSNLMKGASLTKMTK